MATQPMEWTPPSTVKSFVLQPLNQDSIKRFILTRLEIFSENDRARQEGYERVCQNFLSRMFDENQSNSMLHASKKILSNPMDLTVVAQMLANGENPDLLHLQEQQYNLMAADYQRVNNHEFPLQSFSEYVYQNRLLDHFVLDHKNYFKELLRMEEHKLAFSRQYVDADGIPTKEYYFRHEQMSRVV